MSKNKSKGSPKDSSQDNGTDLSVFMTVFFYCILIIFLPVSSFFGLKTVFESLQLTSVSSNVYSAVGAVIVLHLALGIYLYRAYKSDEKPKPKQAVKQD